jgi:hypothetical protein
MFGDGRGAPYSINHITAPYGLTLTDLVTYRLITYTNQPAVFFESTYQMCVPYIFRYGSAYRNNSELNPFLHLIDRNLCGVLYSDLEGEISEYRYVYCHMQTSSQCSRVKSLQITVYYVCAF